MDASYPTGSRVAPKTLLAAEVGSNVRLAAFGGVEGSSRLLAVGESETTHSAPYFDPAVGFDQARFALRSQVGFIADIEDTDPCAVTGGGIGRAATVALISNLDADSHARIVNLINVQGFDIVAEFHAPNKKLARQFDPEDLANRLLLIRASVVAVALQNDRGWESLAMAVDILKYALVGRIPGYSPGVMLLHSDDPEPGLVAILADEFEFFQVGMRAGLDAQSEQSLVRSQIAEAYQFVTGRDAARFTPAGLDATAVTPLGHSLGIVAREMAANNGISVVILHAEPLGASVAISEGRDFRVGSFGYDADVAAVGHIGLCLPIEEIVGWIPAAISQSMAEAHFRNRAWRPWLVPETSTELLLDHAAAHLALRRAVRSIADPSPPVDLIVCTGRTLSGAPRLIQAALCGINGYMPPGYCQLAVDRPGVLAMCGALTATGTPTSAEPYLVHVATSLSCEGIAKFGADALAVEVVPRHGEPISRSVAFGAMERITWDGSVVAEVKSWPGGKLDAGGGKGRATALRSGITSGIGGLIIDARGRPLQWPKEGSLRRAALLQWFQSTDSYVLPSQDLDWGGDEG